MSMHIRDCVSFEYCSFEDVGVQECCFLVGTFSHKVDRRMVIDELFYSVSDYNPEPEYVFYIPFLVHFGLGF